MRTARLKTCSTCRADLPDTDFHRSRSTSDGLEPRCKPCRKTAAQTHATDVELKRSNSRLRFYGITADQYAAMYERQAGLCAICDEPETMTYRGNVKQLSVDHDHATGVVRGLLCAACNFALGKFRDNPALLRAAAHYLER